MPKFFVPNCSENEAEDWWNRARTEAENQGAKCGLRRVFRLCYERDGKEITAEVDKRAEFADGGSSRVVGAIFDALDSSYVIWGPTVGGPSRTVSGSDVLEAVDFDS
jgi:hypothetical protein